RVAQRVRVQLLTRAGSRRSDALGREVVVHVRHADLTRFAAELATRHEPCEPPLEDAVELLCDLGQLGRGLGHGEREHLRVDRPGRGRCDLDLQTAADAIRQPSYAALDFVHRRFTFRPELPTTVSAMAKTSVESLQE